MKFFWKCGALLALGLSVGGSAAAQSGPYGSPSLLPFPETQTTTPGGYQAVAAPTPLPPVLPASYGPTANPDFPADAAPAPAGGSLYGDLGTDTKMFPSSGNGYSGGQCSTGQCDSGNNCCSSCIPCCNGARWFGSIGALTLTRNDANAFWTTYQTNVNANQLMQTKEAGGNWGSGTQVTFGRWWCCCNQGIGLQFVYWQVWGMGGYSNITSAGNLLSTPIDLGGVNITSGAGTFPAGNFFDNSPEHRIWRQDNITNLELNVLNQQIYSVPNRVNVIWLAGFRYFRFQEALTFGSVASGFAFGQNGGADEAYLRSQVTNNLYGVQAGLLANANITQKWGVYAQPKMGIYGNSIVSRNQLYTGDGFSTFDIHGQKTAFSLLGELDLGSYYWLSPNCQIYAGWRVVGVSQVALGDNQFLPYLADTAGFGQIKSNGDLILTGAFAGLAFTF